MYNHYMHSSRRYLQSVVVQPPKQQYQPSLLFQNLFFLRRHSDKNSTSSSTVNLSTRCINSSALKISDHHYDTRPVSQKISSKTSTHTTPLSNATLSSPPNKESLQFGKIFSPHMLTISYSNHQWHDPQIVPYGPLPISPGSACLNYGMTCFEGMKAYRSLSGGSSNHSSSSSNNNKDDEDADDVLLFRPDLNMKRLSRSMERLSLPGYDFNPNELIRCIMKLILLDQEWIPQGEGYSLYLRPNVIAMNENLGLAHPESLLLYVVTSPVGPYYKSGFQPIRLLCESKYVRAYKGGTGNCKIGGNYAPTMLPAKEAADRGYSQVLWLSPQDDHVTEVGAMNIFFVFADRSGSTSGRRKEIVTPPLERGDILPGVTRQSIVELAQAWEGYDMVERNVTMAEIQQAVHDGTLVEAFGAGTAAVVTPIQCIHYKGVDLEIPATGAATKRAWKELMDIQYGKVPHPWSVKCSSD